VRKEHRRSLRSYDSQAAKDNEERKRERERGNGWEGEKERERKREIAEWK